MGTNEIEELPLEQALPATVGKSGPDRVPNPSGFRFTMTSAGRWSAFRFHL